MAFDGKKVVEDLFFAVTCISCFTCIIRSDYNFATGFLCYYMIKNSQMSKITNTAKSVRDDVLLAKITLSIVDFTEPTHDCYGHLVGNCHEVGLGWKSR